MVSQLVRRIVWVAVGSLSSIAIEPCVCAADEPVPIPVGEVQHEGPVNFETEILPILRGKCLACHNQTTAESELVLETPETMRKGGSSGPAVVPGDVSQSLLLKLASHQEEPIMPPAENTAGARPLTPDELGLLKLWIQQGAQAGGGSAASAVGWQPLPGALNPIYAAALSPDGQYAAAGRANQLFLYHVPSRRELGRLTDPSLADGKVYTAPGVADLDLIQSLCFSPDSRRLASGGYRTIRIWLKTGEPQRGRLQCAQHAATAITVSRSGRQVAVGHEDGSIELCDAASGSLLATLRGPSGAVRCLAWSDDDAVCASISTDQTLRLWNVAAGETIAVIQLDPTASVVALIGHRAWVAVGGSDGVIRLWEPLAAPTSPAAGETAAPQPPSSADSAPVAPRELRGHDGPIATLECLVSEPPLLVSGGQDGTLRIWDVVSGKPTQRMKHGGPITALAARSDGKRIASAGPDGTIRLWEPAAGRQIAELRGDLRASIQVSDMARGLAVAKRLIEAAKADLQAARDRKTAEEANAQAAADAARKAEEELAKKVEAAKQPLAAKETAEKALEEARAALQQAAPADQQAAQAKASAAEKEVKTTAEAAAKVFEEQSLAERAVQAARRAVERANEQVKKSGEAIPPFETEVAQAESRAQEADVRLNAARENEAASARPILALAFAPDNVTLAAGGESAVLTTWDSEAGVALESHRAHEAPIRALAGNHAGAFVSVDAGLGVAATPVCCTWQLERTIGAPDRPETLADRVTALAFSPDGSLLASGGGEPSRSGELKIWNPSDGSLVRSVPEAHSDTVLAVAFSPDGRLLASGSSDRLAKIFEVPSGVRLRICEGHTHHVLGIQWRADGRMLATSGADNVVKVWNPLTAEQLRTISGFAKEVTGIQFLGDSDEVVSSCGDATVRIMNAANGQNLRSLPGATDFVQSVGVSSSGEYIAAGGQDSVLRIWRRDGKTVVDFKPSP